MLFFSSTTNSRKICRIFHLVLNFVHVHSLSNMPSRSLYFLYIFTLVLRIPENCSLGLSVLRAIFVCAIHLRYAVEPISAGYQLPVKYKILCIAQFFEAIIAGMWEFWASSNKNMKNGTFVINYIFFGHS